MTISEADNSTGTSALGYSRISNYDVWQCSSCVGFFIVPYRKPPKCPYCGETR